VRYHHRCRRFVIPLFVVPLSMIFGFCLPSGRLLAREWTDSTGKIKQQADLVDFDSRLVVLRKADGFLVALPMDSLSKADQDYLKTAEAKAKCKSEECNSETWTLADGKKLEAAVVKYGRKTISFNRQNSQLYVNDKPFKDFSPLQQGILLKVVSNSERGDYPDAKSVENLLAFRKNNPLAYTEEGVLLQMPDGQLLAVPFFMFSDKDLKVLEPGWQAWVAADKDDQRQEDQSHMLRAEANDYQHNQDITHQLQYVQFASQWFDLWEVALQAPNGETRTVTVPARDSRQAQAAAMTKLNCPNCAIVGTRMISRR
jgi:hypothetical protein